MAERLMSSDHDVLDEITRQVQSEPDQDRAMAAAVATLKRRMPDYSWVGIYLLDGNELVLGPFLGRPSPHTRIPLGRGICGAAAAEQMTIIVDDVNDDSRYLACSLDTRSEIVVPIMHGGQVLGEIDIDSHQLAAFGDADRDLLEGLAAQLAVRLAARAAEPR
jgi:L-methionine (R)-S-oxide reductase